MAQPFPWMAAASAASSILGNIGAKKRSQRQFQQNKKLAEYSYDRQNEQIQSQWDRETKYNDPKAQMQRYKNAGINPHMAYASGGGQNTASQGSIAQYEQQPSEVAPSLAESSAGLINNYLQTQTVQTTLRKQKADARSVEIDNILKAENLSTKKRTVWEKANNEYLQEAQKAPVLYGDKGKGKLTKYQQDLSDKSDLSGIQKLIGKSQEALNKITASNLITNDQLVEMQTQVAKAQFDFLKSDWFKSLPSGIRAIFMALGAKFTGVK